MKYVTLKMVIFDPLSSCHALSQISDPHLGSMSQISDPSPTPGRQVEDMS